MYRTQHLPAQDSLPNIHAYMNVLCDEIRQIQSNQVSKQSTKLLKSVEQNSFQKANIFSQIQEFPAFYGTQRFNGVFTHEPTTSPCPQPDEFSFGLHNFILSVATNGCKLLLVTSHDGTTKGPQVQLYRACPSG